jgi:hypothetical protein
MTQVAGGLVMVRSTRLAGASLVLLTLAVSGSGQERQVETRLAELGKRYGLVIVPSQPTFPVKTFHGAIDGKEASRDDIDSYAPILASEWNCYPVSLVKRSKLRRIILCRDLSFAGQPRTAIPDFEHDDLYLDVARGRYSEPYVRKVIHHEFFHVIDYRNGTLYADDRWSRLLPKDTRYGTGGKDAQNDSSVTGIRDDLPGFLNKYATTGVEEDKAELFAHMIVSRKIVDERAAKDAVLRAKVVLLRDVLKAFCPEMDEKFWKAASSVERSAK